MPAGSALSCPACGAALGAADGRHCSHCGASLGDLLVALAPDARAERFARGAADPRAVEARRHRRGASWLGALGLPLGMIAFASLWWLAWGAMAAHVNDGKDAWIGNLGGAIVIGGGVIFLLVRLRAKLEPVITIEGIVVDLRELQVSAGTGGPGYRHYATIEDRAGARREICTGKRPLRRDAYVVAHAQGELPARVTEVPV